MIIEIQGHYYSSHDFYHICPVESFKTKSMPGSDAFFNELKGPDIGYRFILELRRGEQTDRKQFSLLFPADATEEDKEKIKEKLEAVKQTVVDLWDESDRRIVLNMNDI